ncbi:MAG TPA: ABC transporter substrate-binding protein [Xanthobacteraceae bacterium]|nr:ABC transporter substrate-binding protein [Xanthobacteraceae bacterium]
MRAMKFAWAGLSATALCFALAGAARAEPVQLRVAWVAPIANWISMWLDKKDLARHFGQSYVFEPVHFAGTPPMITAIANNEVEVGDLAYSTLPIAIKNAGMEDTRVIADDFQDGVDGYWSVRFAVLKDGPIKKVEDLKGKVVATNAEGSAVDIAMKAMLRKHGLENKRDYTVVEAPFPAMKAMLTEHKVDLVPAVLPFALDPQLQDVATTLFTAKDAIGVSQFVVFDARQAFIEQHRAALVDWLEDTQRILHWFMDPANHDEVAQIAGRLAKAPPERMGWVFSKTDAYRDPNMMPNLDALQRNVDMTKELGYANASFDVKAYSDLGMVEEAATRLK